MKKVLTKDGSMTFYNEDAKQCYHSTSGAVEEALEKHVIPGNVKELAKTGNVNILDVCFGIGYNSAVAIDVLLSESPSCNIEVTAIESDPEILKKILKLKPNLIKNYDIIKKAVRGDILPDGVNIKIIIKDLQECLPVLKKKYDVVFFDPFSPKTNPELWSEKIFKQLYHLMKQNARLTTYSCASKVRVNMARAGFKVIDGPCVGRRAPSTIAIK